MLRLLGAPRVTGSDGQGLPRAAFLAVALLDLAPGRTLTREALAAHLRDGGGPSRSANYLRQLIARIRNWERETGQSLATITPTEISRDSDTLPSDLVQFLDLGEPTSAASLRLLSDLYGGDFLLGIEDGSEATRQWVAEQREWLRQRFVGLALAGAKSVGGQVAHDVLRRLTEISPYDDAIVRALMLTLRGDDAAVRTAFDRFSQRLATDEMGSEPEPATRALLRELTTGSLIPAAPQPVSLATAPIASLDSVPRLLILPPADDRLPTRDQRLGNALIDEVTHTLGRLRTFAVFAPHTARQLVLAPFPSGNPYGADYLVTTAFRPGNAGYRLRVSLTRVDTHELLLTEDLPFAPAELSERHFHLASIIGTRIAQGIERTELHIYARTETPSAYVHYLLGCEAMQRVDLRSLRRAKSHFHRALRMSPDFVAARAWLARAISLEWVVLERNEREPIERAVSLAREAASIDPRDPDAHCEIGNALIYLGDIDEGVDSLRSATDLGPHRADMLFHYGDGLVHYGDMPGARRVMDKALSLNPIAPDVYHWVSATADFFLGDYRAASITLSRMTNREPAARVAAAVEAMVGNLEAAAHYRDIYMAAHPDFRLDDYMYPLRRPEDRQHYLEGLRLAGFT